MRASLVIPGGPRWPNPATIAANSLDDGLFYDVRTIDLPFVTELRRQRIPVGFQIDPSWWPGMTGPQLADRAHKELNRLGATTTQLLPVLFDIETHDMEYVLAWHTRWRQLRWKRDTLWTFEPLQGGNVGDLRVVTMAQADANLRLVPQLYLGTPRLYPVSERAAVDDLTWRGMPGERTVSFYDGEKPLPVGWNGIAYNFDVLAAANPLTRTLAARRGRKHLAARAARHELARAA